MTGYLKSGVAFLVLLVISLASSAEQYHHYDYSRLQYSNQSWKCWNDSYKPAKELVSKTHESGNGTVATIGRLLRIDQNDTLLFLFTSNSNNSKLSTTFTVQRNKLVRLLLDNVGLRELQLPSQDDCRLSELSVPRNQLTSIANVQHLTALRKLDLSYNQLEQFDLAWLKGASSLKQLLLNSNRLATFTSTSNVNLPILFKLDLSHNNLKTLDVTKWTLPKLEFLHVDFNQLKRIEGYTKGKFPLVKGFDPMGTNNWDRAWLNQLNN